MWTVGPGGVGMGWSLRMKLVCVSGDSPLAKGFDGNRELQPFLCCVEVVNSKSACLKMNVKSCLCSKKMETFACYLDLQLFLKKTGNSGIFKWKGNQGLELST